MMVFDAQSSFQGIFIKRIYHRWNPYGDDFFDLWVNLKSRGRAFRVWYLLYTNEYL